MALERAQQEYQLPGGATAIVWRGAPQRGRRAFVYAAVTLADGTALHGPARFATWEEAETWMRAHRETAE